MTATPDVERTEPVCSSCNSIGETGELTQLSLSPVAHLLQSFSSLTVGDRAAVDDFISTLDSRIAHIDAQIEHITKVRRTLAINRAVHRNRIQPVNRIPDELLLEIFRFYLPKPTPRHPAVSMSRLMTASHVCRRWRNVVISEARNWNVMNVTKMSSPMIDLWALRSRDYPLAIIESSSRPPDRIILQQAHRLQMVVAYSETLKDLSESGLEFPMLQVLYCRAVTRKELPQFRLPYNQITHLAIHSDIRWILAHFPSLISLDIEYKLGLSPSTPRPITHQGLQHLKIHNAFDTHRATTPFQVFDLPSLKALYLLKIGSPRDIPTGAIKGLLASSNALATLVLHNTCPDESPSFVKILETLPVLQKLYVGDDWDFGYEDNGAFFRHIVDALSTRRGLVQNLKSLTLIASTANTAQLMKERSLVTEKAPYEWQDSLGCSGDGAWDLVI
ncbi:hypothetical protein ONZ45_g11982 [Pleurotus djamor]|nr:hypothetical protein ONZ45_g11982 [Pleurotus djamor]